MTTQAASSVVSLADYRQSKGAQPSAAKSERHASDYEPRRLARWGALNDGEGLYLPDACTSEFIVEVEGVVLTCRIYIHCKNARTATSPASLHLVRVFWLNGDAIVGKVVALVQRTGSQLSSRMPVFDCMTSWLDAFTELSSSGERCLVRDAAHAWPNGWGKIQCRIYGAEILSPYLGIGSILEVFAETLRALSHTLYSELGITTKDINFTAEARDVANPADTSAVSSELWGLMNMLSLPRFALAEGLAEPDAELGVPHNVYVIPANHPILIA